MITIDCPILIKEFINLLEKLNNKMKNLHSSTYYRYCVGEECKSDFNVDTGVTYTSYEFTNNYFKKKLTNTQIKNIDIEKYINLGIINRVEVLDSKNKTKEEYYLEIKNLDFYVSGKELYDFIKNHKKDINNIFLSEEFIRFYTNTEEEVWCQISKETTYNNKDTTVVDNILENFAKILNYPIDITILESIDKNVLNEVLLTQNVEREYISFSKKQIPLYKESDDSEYFISIYENNHLNLMVLETNNKEFNINVKNHILYI
jgi:hypothetical protein